MLPDQATSACMHRGNLEPAVAAFMCLPATQCLSPGMSTFLQAGYGTMLYAGHSLGGALAQLAAHDIARAAEARGLARCSQQEPGGLRLTCYTFGSPRVGNHAFAREYNKVWLCWLVMRAFAWHTHACVQPCAATKTDAPDLCQTSSGYRACQPTSCVTLCDALSSARSWCPPPGTS